ncbi:acyl-CoA dehydrogenase family protein [Nocardioides campestrisoli]|uniref:acyl-CoA dehydrogenase family protein n=1 Tax=Nocardioides campestrisoli TaxID=2736757 RepID=UPI00163D5791|nr:acyl-CoA dehydrogenase family protein [Nocardioides campestrisoli]
MSALAESTRTHEEGRRLVAETAERVLAEHPVATTGIRELLGAIFDAGLAWVHFPVGHGGLGVDAGLQEVANRIFGDAGVPHVFELNPMGYGMAGPTIAHHGSDELRTALLRPLFTCEHLWCQLFSEPGAGSDLAGLATRAVKDGDEWVVDGQKVWTSLGHVARWAMLLARTDPGAAKHQGLTYFVVDMTSPGVSVRPLRQMTGEAEFNEVFLEGVRIPDSQRLGDVGAGWSVAMTTLMNERNAIGGGSSVRNDGPIGTALSLWRDRPDLRTPALEERLVALFRRADAARLTGDRQRVERGHAPIGPEGSAAKLVWAELGQAVMDFCMDLLGPEAGTYSGYDLVREHEDVGDGVIRWAVTSSYDDVQRAWLRSRAYTIEGGTSDVLRNIIGERLLGLPGDLRADRGPWSQVPRG